MSGFLEAAIAANEELAAYLRQTKDDSLFDYADKSDKGIGYGGDRSLKIDLFAESLFIKYLSSFGRINSEECGPVGSGADEIVIDPIDGSSNIASGIPYYGSSIALKRDGKATESIVCNLATLELFAKEGDRRFRGRLFEKETRDISRALKPHAGVFEKAYSHPEEAEILRKKGFKFRSPGALALSLAYAHNSRFTLSLGRHREYDIIAGLHISDDLYSFVGEGLIILSPSETVFERLKSLFVGS